MAGGLPRSRTYKCMWGALFRQGERQNLGSRVDHAMPPPVKDNDTLAAANNAARPAAASLPPAEAGIKQQTVPLEGAGTAGRSRQPPPQKPEAPAASVHQKVPETNPGIPAAIEKDSGAKIPEPKLVAPPAPRIAPPAALAPARANPEVPVNAAPENSIEPSFPIVDPSRGADAKAFIISAQSETPPLLSTLAETTSPAASETKPAGPAAVHAAQAPV